jgi:multicomponent Na+:H+ antiporter subunit B
MSIAARRALFLVSAAALGGLLIWAVTGLPDFGHFEGAYGQLLNSAVVPERHSTNVVTAVVFDYRGFDTMGEEFILFAAVMGAALLLRGGRGGGRGAGTSPPSDALRTLASPVAALIVLVGLYTVIHGTLTPGGGFQGGVVLASALVLAYLASGYASYRRLSPTALVDFAEGAALTGFVLVGIAGAVAGDAFLDNVIPLGTSGSLLSAGTIAVLNGLTAVAVAAGFTLFFIEFLEELATGEGRA